MGGCRDVMWTHEYRDMGMQDVGTWECRDVGMQGLGGHGDVGMQGWGHMGTHRDAGVLLQTPHSLHHQMDKSNTVPHLRHGCQLPVPCLTDGC